MFWDRRNSICGGSEVRESNIAREMARSCEKTKANQTKIHHAPNFHIQCAVHILNF